MQTYDTTHAPEKHSTKVFQAMSPVTAVPESAGSATRQHTLQRTPGCACGGGCPRCAGEVAAKRSGAVQAVSADSAASLVSETLSAPGEPLNQTVRNNFESRFQQDFGDVRVHRDERAAESARAVNAHAYTVGRDIVFAAGQYEPETVEGNRLIAHELTHVLQQRGAGNQSVRHGARENALTRHSDEHSAHSSTQAETAQGSTSSLRVSHPSDASEQEADRVAQAVTERGGAAHAAPPSVKHSTDSGLIVQRDNGEDAAQNKDAGKSEDKDDVEWEAAHATAVDSTDTLTWPQVLPDNYVEAQTLKKKDPERYKSVVEICDSIKEYRNNIPVRHFKEKGTQYAVFDLSSKKPAAQDNSDPYADTKPNYSDESGEAASYRQWLKGAKTPEEQAKVKQNTSPEGKLDQAGVDSSMKSDNELRIQLAIWHELLGDEKTPGEGDPSAINAYDSEGITWGAGFSGKGPMQEMMYKHLFEKDKGAKDKSAGTGEAQEVFMRAGISVEQGDGGTYKFVVVDVDNKWKLPESEGRKAIARDPHLLSLFVNVAQGVDFMKSPDAAMPGRVRQAVYNAQWEQFKAGAGNIKSVVELLKNWKDEALGFAGHIVHWGLPHLTWSQLAATGGNAAALRNMVLPTLPKTDNVVSGDAAASFMRFGKGLMTGVMTSSLTKVPGKTNVLVNGKYFTAA